MKKNLIPFLALLAFSGLATAQVDEWVAAKGVYYVQTAEDTQPVAPSEWAAFASVDTINVGDATSVTFSGGNIPVPIPLIQDGNSWEIEACFATQGELDALIPSGGTYSFTLSGGSLGTLVQTFQLPAAQYPNVPYFTGTTWSDILNLNSAADFAFDWNDPGPLTASSGATVFEIYDVGENGVFEFQVAGAATSAVLPGGTLSSSQFYTAELLFTNEAAPSGAGGFGVSGRVGHLTLTETTMLTIAAAQVASRNGGSNPNSYTADAPVIGNLWTASVDPTTTGHTHAQVSMRRNPTSFVLGGGQTLLVAGPQLLKLPLTAGPAASWAATIPNDISLSGLTIRTQAVHVLGTSPFALSNAQDLTFGS